AVTAANKLATREREQARLEAQEALDDPLVMAGRRLSGEAFAGEVTDVVMAYSESKRPSPRPLVTVRTDDRPHLGARTRVYRSLGGKPQAAEFVGYEDETDGADGRGRDGAEGGPAGEGPAAVDSTGVESAGAGQSSGGLLVLRIMDKMGRGREPEAGSVPEKGDRVCFTLFEHEPRGGARLPDPEETPWTHGGPPDAEASVREPADPVTEEDVL
ncbi:hypothetical protein ACFVIN_34085, partial [Streptomyces prasinus]